MVAPRTCMRRWLLAHQDFLAAASAIERAASPKQAIGQVAAIGSKFCKAVRIMRECPDLKKSYKTNERVMRDVVYKAVDIAVEKCESRKAPKKPEKKALIHEIGVEYQ